MQATIPQELVKPQDTCPTCGAPVIVCGDGSTCWYQPVSVPPFVALLRLAVQPGEVLVVKAPGNIPAVERKKVHDFFEFALPGVTIVVVHSDVDFAVISDSAAIEAAKASSPTTP